MNTEQIQNPLVFVSRRFHSHRLSCLVVTAIFVLCGCALLLLLPGGNNRNISIADTKELISNSTSQLLEKLRRVIAENLLMRGQQQKAGEDTSTSVRSKKKNGGMFKGAKGRKKMFKKHHGKKLNRKEYKRDKQTHSTVITTGLYVNDSLFELSKNWTLEDTDAEREVMRRRAQKVREVCDNMARLPNYRELPMEQLEQSIIWVVKHDLAWCPIFKASSSTWVKNVLIIAGDSLKGEILLNKEHPRAQIYYSKPDDAEEADAFLQRAMRLLIVRHPLDRILSAYRDKMLRVVENLTVDKFREMQKNIHRSFPDPELPDGYDPRPVQPPLPYQPTFNQFLLKIKKDVSAYWKHNGRYYINLHWRPYWAVCSPCSFNYSIIAKVETLQRDQEFIVRDRRLSDFPLKGKTHSSKFDSFSSSKEASEAYYSRVPRSLLEEIIRLYEPDFEFFGYSGDDHLKLSIPGI